MTWLTKKEFNTAVGLERYIVKCNHLVDNPNQPTTVVYEHSLNSVQSGCATCESCPKPIVPELEMDVCEDCSVKAPTSMGIYWGSRNQIFVCNNCVNQRDHEHRVVKANGGSLSQWVSDRE